MSALDELERTLARAVDAGAAADPARANASMHSNASTTTGADEAAAHGGRRRRRWPRGRGGRLLVTVLVAGGVTTGALAATGALRVTEEPSMPGMRFVADEGAGVPTSPPKLLPLRVPDPQGGPPWVIRTFTTSRHAACAQAGQLYGGKFGLVDDDGTGDPVFRVVRAGEMGETIQCTTELAGEFPVLRGLRTWRMVGGNGRSKACSIRPGRRDPCPVTAVTIVRFGLLGPAAKSAKSGAPDGPGAQQQLSAKSGGAYLFVDAEEPTAQRRMQVLQAEAQEDVDRKFPRPDLSSLSKVQRREAQREWLRRNQYATRRYRENRVEMRRLGTQMYKADPVWATFADGTVRRVLGGPPDRTPLPGVTPTTPAVPASTKTVVSARPFGVDRAVRVAFRAPVPIDRMGFSYIATVHGPRAPNCERPDLGYEWIERDIKAGELIRVNVQSPQSQDGRGRLGWCAGAKYEARVRLRTLRGPSGDKVDTIVGRATFTMP